MTRGSIFPGNKKVKPCFVLLISKRRDVRIWPTLILITGRAFQTLDFICFPKGLSRCPAVWRSVFECLDCRTSWWFVRGSILPIGFRIHVNGWYMYLRLPSKSTTCRQIYHTLTLWVWSKTFGQGNLLKVILLMVQKSCGHQLIQP